MIDLDQMEKDANKAVSKHINKIAKKVQKENEASFAEAFKQLELIDQLMEERKKLLGVE